MCGCRFLSFGLGLRVQVDQKKCKKQTVFIVVSKAVQS